MNIFKQRIGYKLERKKSDYHDQAGVNNAQRHGFGYTLFMSCTVVIRYYRHHTVIKSEYGHENKALKFKIYTEYSLCGFCGIRVKHADDLVYADRHDRAYCGHYNGRHADGIYLFYNLKVRVKNTFKRNCYLAVILKIQEIRRLPLR